jgi:hypothetical protein
LTVTEWITRRAWTFLKRQLEDDMKSIPVLACGWTALVALTLAVGCGGPSGRTPKAATKTSKGVKGDHAAHGAGPHGGTVADWGGGKYHVEFTVDHAKQEATVYILSADEKTPAPIKAKDGQLLLTIKEPSFQVVLQAAPQKGDPEGMASCFIGKHERLGKEQEFAGTISGEVDDTPYTGDFKEEPEGAGKK